MRELLIRADAGEAGIAKWSMLFPKGQFFRGDMPGGTVNIDDAYCATLVANWRKRGEPELPIDYFHRGGSGVAVPNEQKIASGWIQKLEARADGLYALVKWTDKARALILADELRYLSPEWHPDDIDVRSGKRQGPTLHGAGLLNDPLFKEMPRVAAAAIPPANTNPAAPEKNHMNPILAAALAALGLHNDATEAQIATRKAELDAEKAGLLKASAEKEATLKAAAAPLEAKVAALSSSVETLVAANKVLAEDAKKVKVEALVAKLQNDGKGNVRIIAAQVDAVRAYANAVGVDEAEKFYMAGPVVLKLGEKGHAGSDAAESFQSAHEKLQGIADELVKAGVKREDALIRAMEKNPELAEAATRKAISVATAG